MKINYCLLAFCVVLLTSCQKSPPSAPSAPSAPSGAAATAPAATSAPAPTDLAGTNLRHGKIQPDKYQVCDEGRPSGHGPLGGKHLELGQWVRIKKIGKHGTKVCFNTEDCPSPGNHPDGVKVMWLAGDENMLAGEATFDHKDQNGKPAGTLPHFVQIYSDPSEPVDKTKCKLTNILTIKFCVEDSNSGDDLDCLGTETDLGHVHVEN